MDKKGESMKRAVITGPTGAIGRALINEVINDGYEVLAVVHRSSVRSGDLEGIEHCRVLKLDLSEYGFALDEMKKQGIPDEKYDIFFNLAWEAPFGDGRDDLLVQTKNVHYAVKAVSFAKALGCSTFVGIGSQAEYGRTSLTLRPDSPTNPETGYGSAKLCAGNLTRYACEPYGMKHIWIRVLSVYGPHDRAETMISTAISQMSNNEDTAFTPCEQIWDYLYSEDAARAILLAGENGVHGKNYVLGSGRAYPLRWYVEKIAELTGYNKEIGFGKIPYSEKQVMHLVADISELTKDTGFEPVVEFEEGIRRMLGKD